MKKLAALLVATLALLLAACATAPVQRSPTEVDSQYVASIERAAKQIGVDVMWVNPPRKSREVREDG